MPAYQSLTNKENLLKALKGNQWNKGKKRSKECLEKRHQFWIDKRGGLSAFDFNLRRQFNGFTEQQYNDMLEKQGGVCAICKGNPGKSTNQKPRKNFCIDHDHITGKVRGLLCHKCNAGLGLLGDTVESIEMTIKYLKGSD